MASILRDPAPPLPESVPDGLRDWMSTALNKDPRRRFGTAREMAESLRQIAWEGKAPDAVEGDLGPEVSLEGPTPCFWTPDTELVEATPACGATLVDMAKSPPGNGPAFRTRSRWNLSAALGASILVLVAGAVGLGAWRDVDHRADVADANTPPHIFLRISAAPLDARLVLDGKVLPSNPFEAEVARDGEAHLLRVEAPGHAVVERVLSFQGDVLLALALTPSSSEATGSTGSATPASPHVQATRVPFGAQHSSPRAQRPESRKPLPEGSNPRGVPSPRTARPIDEGDPYSE